MITRPSVPKSAGLAIIAGVGVWWLVRTSPSTAPPSISPVGIDLWWSTVGTPGAVMTITRWLGVVLGAYLTITAAVGVLGGLAGSAGRFGAVVSLWRLISTESLRRMLAIGSIAVWAANPVVASASDLAPPPIILVDIGPASLPVTTTPESTALPVDDTPPPTVDAAEESAGPANHTWTVAPGDHLWGIAEQTLSESGAVPSVRETTRYWKRLIAENAPVLGGHPDLIHPGQLIALPDL